MLSLSAFGNWSCKASLQNAGAKLQYGFNYFPRYGVALQKSSIEGHHAHLSRIYRNAPGCRTFSKSSAMAHASMNGGNFAHDNTVAPKADRVLPLFSLQGRTAIISGAGAGIGLAVAQALAEAGANVAIWYNSNKKALDRAREIEQTFGVRCASLASEWCYSAYDACASRSSLPGQYPGP